MMSPQRDMVNELDEERAEADNNDSNIANDNDYTESDAKGCTTASRKERRKAAKKEKRKKKRQEVAELTRRKEEARLDDPDELMKLQAEEEQERLRVERERREFEERERRIIEEWERKKAQEQREEEERRKAQEEDQLKQNQIEGKNDVDEDGWEYVEDGPPEIIWQGNEIIVKKKKIRVKKDREQHSTEEDRNRPTSNPLPPQSEAYSDYKNAPVLSAHELLENVAQETPNFGTEQDKAHCPFHLKTGACRFGSRCSRIHFYPDKSCTLLIKNMYNGPGLAWEQDEGLEYTDEEVERAYEEFYEDVHTEFMKFGEIINFKVCRNGSSHLRGNVYVHYKSLESAVLACQSVNGRYYAGKQIQCEFVGVTRWKVAICGEFMKSKLKTCSRGTACNFIHCFRNPGGDYEWADWDKQPPKYWLKEMAALFGYSGDYGYDKEQESPRFRNSCRISADGDDRYHSRRSRSREIAHSSRGSRKYSADNNQSSVPGNHHKFGYKKDPEIHDVKASNFFENTSSDSDSDMNTPRDRGRDSCDDSTNHFRAQKHRKLDTRSSKSQGIRTRESDRNSDLYNHHRHERSIRQSEERVKRNRDAGSGRGWSDKDRIEAAIRSGTATGEMQCNRDFISPDDHWDVRDSTHSSNANGSWSDEERHSARRYKEKSPRFYDSEKHKKFTRQSDYRQKRSSNWDDLARWDGEVENENVNHSSRKYGSSDSSSGYYERGESERQSSHLKKSKRKRDPEKEFNTESQIRYLEGKSSRAADCRIDEAVHDRGCWEPGQDNSVMEAPLR